MKHLLTVPFRQFTDAEAAVDKLLGEGIDHKDIGILSCVEHAGADGLPGAMAGAGGMAVSPGNGVGGGLLSLGAEHDKDGSPRGSKGAVVAVRADAGQADEIEARLMNLATGGASGNNGGEPIVKTDTGPEHWAPENPAYSASFDEFAGVQACGDSTILAGRGAEYARYKQAFDLGYRAASNARFHNRDWMNVEDELRGEWEGQREESWDLVRGSVRQGWEAERGAG